MNNQFTTLAEAVEKLKKNGFTNNLDVNENGLLDRSTGIVFGSSEVKLLEFHRFEGTSDPADSSIVYAIETKSGIKGTIVDSYGADGSEMISDFMNNVEQNQFET